MPFRKTMLLAFLVASTAMCRSIVNMNQADNLVHGGSVPASGGGHHDLPEKNQPINQAGSFWDGRSDAGAPSEIYPDSRSDDHKSKSGRRKHHEHKAIGDQKKKVKSLRKKLDEAITKLEELEGVDNKYYGAKGEKGYHHKSRKSSDSDSNAINADSPVNSHGIVSDLDDPYHPSKAPHVKRSDYPDGPAPSPDFAPATGGFPASTPVTGGFPAPAPATGGFPGSFGPTTGDEGEYQRGPELDGSNFPSGDYYYHRQPQPSYNH
ncbi:putative signal peptide protein [Puccinia sorghi]|uniref:Putative signal peptide protein n=1 Tax=Puccinia sorghi TaxID=27349 RepID=A0A0L6UXZ5_9BASI|nr:putative signal peptide protein [Puccinia sorghi]